MWHRIASYFGAQFPPKDPQQAFARRIRHRVHTLTDLRVTRVDDEELSLVLRSTAGKDVTLFLGNLYRETRDLPESEAAARIDHCLAVLTAEDDAAWEHARGMLLPVLRVTTFGGGTDLTLLTRPFVPFVDVYFAVDSPTHTSYVSPKRLADWGVDEDTFFSAVDACLADLPPVRSTQLTGGEGIVHEVRAEDCHAPSRVLVPGFVRSYERRVEGRPVVAFPQRELLLVTGDADEAGLRYLEETAKRIWEEDPRSISPALYSLGEGDVLVPFVPPGDGVLATDGKLLHHVLAASEYGASKAILDKAHEATDVDVWVATFDLRRRDDGSSRSRSLWTQGVHSWLPRTDIVCLAQPSQPADEPDFAWIAEVPFEAVEGLLTLVEGVKPPRYATPEGFPSRAEALAMPGAEALHLTEKALAGSG